MQITYDKIKDVIGILLSAFAGLTGIIVWFIEKRNSKKQDKIDFESKLLVQLDKISQKYVEVHQKYHAMQEVLIDIKAQNRELQLTANSLTVLNENLRAMIENLTKENQHLQDIVRDLTTMKTAKN